jgi:ABC-type multidrug transport system ATPase subunit/ABC-type transport system involved in multi-copper enzyme maturation permease subunit
MRDVLDVNDVSLRFGDLFALEGVTFGVRRGEIVGLIGPNGAGKTTLLEIVSGLLPADHGTVSWDGAVLPPARRKQVMFYLPESVALYPEHRTGEVLELFARLFGRSSAVLAEAIADLGLTPILPTRAGALSKGYRRRLLLALGLIAPQPLLVMDEPFDGLDLRQTREVMGLLRSMARRGRTLLLSIHQLTDAERICDRFVLLSGGAVRGEGRLDELRTRAGSGRRDSRRSSLPSRERETQLRIFPILLRKEWRDLVAGRAFWALLLLLSPLVGYSFVQALALYGEASKSAAGLPEVARNLSPLDGILVPTLGGLYLTATFLFPFVAIRTLGSEKQTGSLKLLLQLPCSLATVMAAKITMLGVAWLLMAAPCLSAAALWSLAGGHVSPSELANLLLGHLLYGAVIAGIALLAAVLADSTATAAILTLAITIGFWMLDFAAVGETGLLKTLSEMSPTSLLRDFERGIFSLGAALGAIAIAAGLVAGAGVWLNLRTAPARKLALSALVALATGGALAGTLQLHLFADASEDARNSFDAAEMATLKRLDKRLTVLVRLAPEDPRYIDFDRKILGRLRRAMPDVDVRLQSESRSGLFEGSAESYGIIRYRYAGKEDESRSTGAGEVLPIIFGLAGVQRATAAEAPAYPGYPLQVDLRLAQVWFYAVLPILVAALWTVMRGTVFPRRLMPSRIAGPKRRERPQEER